MSVLSPEMSRYRDLIYACFPGARLWFYTQGGELAWLAADDPSPVAETIDFSIWTSDQRGYMRKESDGLSMLAYPVVDLQKNPTHYLVLALDQPPETAAIDKIVSVLAPIADVFSSESQLKTELDLMARELALRYEELNLVYHTDDEVRFLDEGRHALRSLVDNCNDYLNVDLTVFVMPDQGVCIDRRRAREHFDSDTIVGHLSANALPLLTETGKTLVMNNDLEQVIPGVAGKLVVSPVLDGHGQITGVLAIFRKSTGADFVNGDRNLLIVMAGKASRIIQASYDGLTGLMKQDGFERSLTSALTYARRSQQKHTLLHVNIDRMHLVNDTLGYQAGDKALRAVAAVLREVLRESDQIARLGGDEFGVLLHNCPLARGEQVAEKLRRSIATASIEGVDRSVEITACVGIASLDDESDDVISAQAGAEIACAVAKERGRNRWHVYRRDDSALVERQQQMKWVGRIRHAIQNDNLALFSQRIVPLAEGSKGYHFEILVRMLGENNEILPPNLFLPVAERYQMMPTVDRWIIENSLRLLSPHIQTMDEENIVCAINLSGQSLVDEGFAGFIAQQLESNRIPGKRVCFEITETSAIANLDEAQQLIHQVKALGCTFALDDFGAGLSSFGYLRTLPVDYLKLDGSFVRHVVEDETAAAMLAAMNQIGQIVGLKTVAEFVENEAIIERIKAMGINYAQGYGIAKPRPVEEELAELQRVLEPA